MKLSEIKNQFLTDHVKIDAWLHKIFVEAYNISDTGMVTVHQDVTFHGSDISRIPVQFDVIYGDFDCSSSGLSSLAGCPSKVDGDFDCGFNYLTSLKWGPKDVAGRYTCENNLLLTSLEGAPSKIDGIFNISENPLLTSLKSGPKYVADNFDADNCGLTSLEYFPEVVKGSINIDHNKIVSLKGIPSILYGTLSCGTNQINSFEYLPANIEHSVFMTFNNISSLVGINDIIKSFNGILNLSGNHIIEGGLGLLLIEGDFGAILTDADGFLRLQYNILKKYIGKPDKIFECQEELINAQFENYAQL